MSTQYQVIDLMDQMNAQLAELLEECELVPAKDLGLDPRAAHRVWAGLDFVAVYARDRQRFEYYGGFEYHESEMVQTTGDYVFYFRDSEGDRVDNALAVLNEVEEEQSELDERWQANLDAEAEDRYGEHLPESVY